GGTVVHDALTCAEKTEETAQPRQRDLLELGSRGRGAPQHCLLIERCRQKLREDAGRARRGGEVREEPGMVPVRQRWNENAFEVRKDLVEAFAGFGAALRQRATHLAWRDARQNGVPLRSTQIGSDPLHERVPVAPEFGGVHLVSSWWLCGWWLRFNHELQPPTTNGLLMRGDVVGRERLERRRQHRDRIGFLGRPI